MNRTNRFAIFSVFTLLLISMSSSHLWADAPATSQDSPPVGVDPKADEYLRKMGKTLAAAQQFTFEIRDLSDTVLTNGQEAQFARTVEVSMRRPDALAADFVGDLENKLIVYGGGKLAIWNRLMNVYAMQDVPTSLDSMFDFLDQRFGITVALSDLCFPDPYQTMIANVYSGADLGVGDVNGVKCHHLAFREQNIDWQIWVEDSEQALPRKVVITYKDRADVPQYIAFLDKWNLSPQMPDSTFVFTPPADAKRKDLTPVDTSANSSSADSSAAPASPKTEAKP
jgi:hypothetical protein